jgi:hypothetical protein
MAAEMPEFTSELFRRLGMALTVILFTHAAHKPTHNHGC